MDPADFDRISRVRAELTAEGFTVPTGQTVWRWAIDGEIRAVRVGAGPLLVSREDVRRMVTPTPVCAP